MDAFLAFEPPPMPSLSQLLQRIAAVLITLGVHGWAAAALADRLGDPGPKHDGRRTLSPFAHLDLVGFVFGLFYRVAWMTRLDVDPERLRGRRWGAVAVTVGASAALAAASALLLIARPVALSLVGGNGGLALAGVLNAAADVAIATAVIHLLPLPPLLGAAWAFPRGSWWHRPAAGWWMRGVWIALALAGVIAPLVERVIGGWRAWLGF